MDGHILYYPGPVAVSFVQHALAARELKSLEKVEFLAISVSKFNQLWYKLYSRWNDKMASNLDTIQHGSFHIRTHLGCNKNESVGGGLVLLCLG